MKKEDKDDRKERFVAMHEPEELPYPFRRRLRDDVRYLHWKGKGIAGETDDEHTPEDCPVIKISVHKKTVRTAPFPSKDPPST